MRRPDTGCEDVEVQKSKMRKHDSPPIWWGNLELDLTLAPRF